MESAPGEAEAAVLPMLATIEQAIAEVFEKRFRGKSMPFEQAAELVCLQQALMEHISTQVRFKAVLNRAKG